MNISNIYNSVKFIDFVNALDNLVNELLYSKETGFIYLKSKNAINEAEKIIRKFEFESSKIKKSADIKTSFEIIENKKNYFVDVVKKHCRQQLFVWVDEVFDEMIDNSLFKISLNDKNVSEIYNRCINAILWYCDIKEFDSHQKESLLNDFESRFNQAFNSLDSDYLPNSTPQKTDYDLFLKIITLAIEDEDEFLKYDIGKNEINLSSSDFKFLTNLQRDFNTNLKTSIIDDFLLIKSAIELLNLKNSKDKYNFIKQISNDFAVFKNNNQNKLEQQDKVLLVKKRMKLFPKDNLKSCSYFKELLSS